MKQNKIKVYGITGGVGSGKSFVSQILSSHFDLFLIDTDSLARTQMCRGGDSFASVVEEFGEGILGADGEIDRKALAEIVFNDKERLKKLDDITHPRVIAAVEDTVRRIGEGDAFLLTAEGRMPKGVLVESALIIEAGFADMFDDIIYVHAPEADRKKRLMLTRGYSEEKVASVFLSQQPEESFLGIATIVVENPDGTSEEAIIKQVKKAIT